MSELNLLPVLEILSNTNCLQQAVSDLNSIGLSPAFHASGLFDCGSGWYELPNLIFWDFNGVIMVNILNASGFDTAKRAYLKAHQPETVETSVPAASPDLAGEQLVDCTKCGSLFSVSTQEPNFFVCEQCSILQPVIPEPSTDSVDKPLSAIQAALSTPEVRLAILRTERRLKNSRVKGLSS